MENKDHIAEWYKEHSKGLQATPSESIWNDVSEDLEVDGIWENIDNTLTRNRRFATAGWSGGAVVLLLLAWGGNKLLTAQEEAPDQVKAQFAQHSDDKVETITQEIKPSSAIPDSEVQVELPVALVELQEPESEDVVTSNTSAVVIRDLDNASSIARVITTSLVEEQETPTFIVENTDVDPIIPLSPELINTPVKIRLIPLELPQMPKELQSAPKGSNDPVASTQQWSVGAVAQLKNHWLLSNETIDALGAKSLNSAEFDFGKAFGLMVRNKVSDQLDVEAQFLALSDGGQRYIIFNEGEVFPHEIDLDYAQLNLSARATLSDGSRIDHKAVIGVYGAYLERANETISGVDENVTSLYHRHDVGVIIGYELDGQISQHMSWTTGLRWSEGMMNVYKGDAANPQLFNRAANTSFGLHLGILCNF